MKNRIITGISRVLLAVFIVTALCMIASQPAFSDFFGIDGTGIVFAGDKYTLDITFLTGIQKVLSFNGKLFGAFLWEKIILGTERLFGLACNVFELCSKVIYGVF